MNDVMLQQQLNWWLEREPQLLEKLMDSLNTRFSVEIAPSALLLECFKFLYLAGEANKQQPQHRDKFTPSIIVDETWHCLILYTQSYHQFCQKFYGAFIHHHPGGDEEDNYKQLQFTLYALQAQFGKLDATIWPTDAVLDITGQCSTCESYTNLAK